MIADRTRALEEGQKAYKDGKDIDKSNPYQPGIDDHENFREGYLAAAEGVKEVTALEPAPPAPTAVASVPAVTTHDDAEGASLHPASNVESGTPFDTNSGTPFVAVETPAPDATTFTNS